MRVLLVAGLGLSAAACGTTSAVTGPAYPSRVPGAVVRPAPSEPRRAETARPRGEPAITGPEKIGRPYEIAGRWYTPASQPNYDETGIASWYGEAFDGKPTATGELYDMTGVTAAHKTLPLNALVEVTNLDNGRSITLRINDRGPFVDGRIIDLSKGAAEELGVLRAGLAHVRVRYVGPANESAPVQLARSPRQYARAPEAQVEPAPEPEPAPPPPNNPPASTGDYAVQAGTFSQYANAERAAEQVSPAGIPEIRPVQRQGATLYRVLVIGLSGPEEAERALQTVAANGFPDARVVRP